MKTTAFCIVVALGGSHYMEPPPEIHGTAVAIEVPTVIEEKRAVPAAKPEREPAPPAFTIDWEFISAQEGGQRLTGYVPAAYSSRSGVTIATGIDLGQRSPQEIDRLPVSAAVKAKLKPYARMRGVGALRYLRKRPLSLTKAEADALDRAVAGRLLRTLGRHYDAAAEKQRTFEELPYEAQTVIASVGMQYGPHLERATPRFWRLVTSQKWEQAVAELEDFGDAYDARRTTEAQLLRAIIEERTPRPGADPPVPPHVNDSECC